MTGEINSEIIHIVRNKQFGIIGYLVIDKLINGSSFGGVRIIPDENLSELQLVAKSMTCKNAFIGNKIGGAKAAIIISEGNEKYRNDIIVEFGKSISPFIKNGKYIPVMDMGIHIEELQTLYDNAGCNCDVLSWKNTSHEYTAYSCFYATLCALEKKQLSIKDATFSVQGFGSVGSAYANLMCKNGARLVAISNKYSGMIKEEGFDIDELLKERMSKGDNFILSQRNNLMALHSSVLEKKVDILLPASSALAVNEENWKKIKADIIICAANAPMTNDIERSLFYNNKIVVTDFVANCGGILGSIMDNYVTDDIIFHILSTSFKRKVRNLLDQSTSSNKPLVDIVTNDIEKIIDTNYKGIHMSNGKLTAYIYYILSNPLSPIKSMMSKYMSKRYISKYETLWN